MNAKIAKRFGLKLIRMVLSNDPQKELLNDECAICFLAFSQKSSTVKLSG